MADLGTLKNSRTIHPLCQFTLYRFTQIDPEAGLDVETPCAICVIPGEFCNLIQETRVWVVDMMLSAWGLMFADSDEQNALEGLLVDYSLTFDNDCHWTASDTAAGGGLNFSLSFDLEVTINGTDSSLVDLSMDVTLSITGDITDSHTVTYEREGVDPLDADTLRLSATTDRTFDLPMDDEVEFPSGFDVSINDPIWE